jgi:cell division protein FtsN
MSALHHQTQGCRLSPQSMARQSMARQIQHGGFALGMVAGLLVGLALALGVALYITKAPIPFVNKVPQRTAEQDTAETERNRSWDPNAPLGGKNAPRPGADGSGAGSTAGAPTPVPSATPSVTPSVLPPGIATAPAVVQGTGPAAASPASAPTPAKPAKDPAAILAGGAAPPTNSPAPAVVTSTAPALEAFVYFVQAGAYSRSEEAEQQRARLALMGQTAKITEREQAGRTMYRVRVGPFASRDPADALQSKLQEQSIESQIVRVERP